LAPVTRRAAAAAVGAALLAVACAAPIRTELLQVEPPVTVRRIAVVPFSVDPLVGADVPSEAAGFATSHLLDALKEQSALRVVEGPGADASLAGVIRRWSQRQGGTTGVRRPASVWLTLQLTDRDGRVIWNGVYEETQPALSDDLASISRAWERGFQWVTAEELCEYGLRELVTALAGEAAVWS
jgi:hypothetical protein